VKAKAHWARWKDPFGFFGQNSEHLFLKYLPEEPFQHIPVVLIFSPCHPLLPFLDITLNFWVIIWEHQDTPAGV
jgi:hypothetical protein